MNEKPQAVPDFTVFDRRSVPVTAIPLISLQVRGNFSLNHKAYQELGEPGTVELLYDQGRQIIGFRSVDPSTPHAYPVKRTGRGRTYYVAGRAFCDFNGIEHDINRRYQAHTYPGGVLGIDLKEKPLKSTVTRARKKGNEENATA